ncbi:MAG TPA: SAM-dependent methyltransferase [Actinocrinis sp.]|nr:SAM-dependent methyltransferase [Actinocrinis sp.]
MQHRPAWAPDEVDIELPSAARMYDYYLGGSHNFAADRALAEQAIRHWPDLPYMARANRAFLHRSIAVLSELGVDQYLDLGSGIPTNGNVHDVARSLNPAARTVYVDADLVAVAHSAALLTGVPGTAVVHADLRDPQAILADPVLNGCLDLSRPVAVLLLSVLPFIRDEDDPGAVVDAFHDATVPGSYLVVSHGTNDYSPERANRAAGVYSNAANSLTLRSREDVARLMGAYELIPPGLTDMINWRPDPHADPDPLGGDVARYSFYAAVGRRG